MSIFQRYVIYNPDGVRNITRSLKKVRFLVSAAQAGAKRVDQSLDEIPIEIQYTRKNPIEHILLRPGMYVGPTELMPPSPTWVVEESATTVSSSPLSRIQILKKNISHIPALLKIFDEILVNASDNALRKSQYPTTCINVIIDPTGKDIDLSIHNIPLHLRRHQTNCPFISIFNNGSGIPVVIHKNEGVYLPELLFGQLLTGSNFDDGDLIHASSSNSIRTHSKTKQSNKRITGGRHGYGAKLTNIFSKWFEIETLDLTRGKIYRQVWENNMSTKHEPLIVDMESQQGIDMIAQNSSWSSSITYGGYTKVSFIPDMAKLGRNYITKSQSLKGSNLRISDEDYAIMSKRVYDVAACSRGNVTVSLNGQEIPIRSFQDYVQLYRGGSASTPVIYDDMGSTNWEIGVGLSKSGSFEQVSFVNGMATTRGGSHVDTIVKQIVSHITNEVVQKHPELVNAISPSLVKRCLAVYVNAFVENPSFDSQMKESLTSSPDSVDSHNILSDKFLSRLIQKEEEPSNTSNENNVTDDVFVGGPGIMEELIRVVRGRLQSNILKDTNKRPKKLSLSIPKLDDAHFAGTEKGHLATLVLTEGDSAKAFCIAGLEKMGRDYFGVFPLRGKFLNVRDASMNQLSNNAEVKALYSIIGLQFDCKYETMIERSKLRYGHVMLMTDQDTDGSHIKGLIMNFFRHFWPCLLKPAVDDTDGKPFLSSFITPLLKARSGNRDRLDFFSLTEYNKWRASLAPEKLKKWNIKYYKGLGTSTHAEAKEYFSDFSKHHRLFRWESEEDGKYIDLVFEKGRADDRKQWINNRHKTHDLSLPKALPNAADYNSISFQKFINTEMIEFSNADNVRSLPSLVDGLKPSQRKVLYACFKRKIKNEMKVAQLSGYCAEHTSYHHGEAALHATSKFFFRNENGITNTALHLIALIAIVIGMAQDFVGSSNINLLHPSGQFGTRLAGGMDAASPRYIFTQLSPLARLIFPEVDDPLLQYLDDDGQKIEPKCYFPIIPLLICNGCQGIGTGWSTFFPPHDPRDVVECVRAKLSQSPLPLINPWVRGFKGNITLKEDKSGYRTTGICERVARKSILIKELPVSSKMTLYLSAR